ncbi:MAG: histidine phosphatase family protein [Proteobacteria bacterium]|nr:histidine phosphatase family protein [Pseudomonadota bacterium]MDA1058194.1 histidine phosphatase family protein [Pseudomonadota bacterium]
MVTLYLLRHAKSSQATGGLNDEDRPLNEWGRTAAAALGRYMHDHGLCPDLVLSSPARRTRETLEIVRAAAAWGPANPPERFLDRLYLAPPAEILAAITAVAEPVQSILVVGHNPGIHELALAVVTRGQDDYANLLDAYPTGALAVLTSDAATWPGLANAPISLAAFVRPRDLIT